MTRLIACFVVCVAAGCIKAPEIVLVDRATALERVDLHVRNEREAFGPEHVLETIPMVCDDQRCHIYRDGVYVFADATHLSAPFTRAHADDVADFLRAQGIGA